MKSKLAIIQGSPRKRGNTGFACGYLGDRLEKWFDVSVINLCEHRIKHCVGCRVCMRDGSCRISGDDFGAVWNILSAADVIIQAAPVYWYSPPGIMKDFIDRTHSFYRAGRPLAGKRGGIITIATEEGFECAEKILSCWAVQYGVEIVGMERIKAREAGEIENSKASLEILDGFCSTLAKFAKGGAEKRLSGFSHQGE
ncbi:MAG: flavodoxin family protein [Verrucomicrobiae bacterium]|nr:flavodoxin family protein [Verrucomicrobiae bacterium]